MTTIAAVVLSPPLLIARCCSADVLPCKVCTADLSGDGTVGGADLGLVLGSWGQSAPQYDLTGDGVIDGSDLGLMLAAWGKCPAGHPCSDSANPCDIPDAGPGCKDATCCAYICSLDPHCCEVQWDRGCVDLSQSVGGPCDPLGMVVGAVTPSILFAGDLATIAGENLPDDPDGVSISGVAADGATVGFRAIAASPTEIVARLAGVPMQFDLVRVHITPGDGAVVLPSFIPEGVTITPPGAWRWSGGGVAGQGEFSQSCSSVFASDDPSQLDLFGASVPTKSGLGLAVVIPAITASAAGVVGPGPLVRTVTTQATVDQTFVVGKLLFAWRADVAFSFEILLEAEDPEPAATLAAALGALLTELLYAETGFPASTFTVDVLLSGDAVLTLIPGGSGFSTGSYWWVRLQSPG